MLPAHFSVSFPLITSAFETVCQNNGCPEDKLPKIMKFRMWVQKRDLHKCASTKKKKKKRCTGSSSVLLFASFKAEKGHGEITGNWESQGRTWTGSPATGNIKDS